MRPDPMGLRGGVNVFLYVQNNPIGYIDPLGLFEDSLSRYWGRRFRVYYEQRRQDIATRIIDDVLTPIPPGELPPAASPYAYLIILSDHFLDISWAAMGASRDTMVEATERAYWKSFHTYMQLKKDLESYYTGLTEYDLLCE